VGSKLPHHILVGFQKKMSNCDICGRHFTTSVGFSNHERTCSKSLEPVEGKSTSDEEMNLEQHDGEITVVEDEDVSNCRFIGAYTDIVEEEALLEGEGGEGDGMEGEEVTINWKKRIAMMESFEKMKVCDDTVQTLRKEEDFQSQIKEIDEAVSDKLSFGGFKTCLELDVAHDVLKYGHSVTVGDRDLKRVLKYADKAYDDYKNSRKTFKSIWKNHCPWTRSRRFAFRIAFFLLY
jgi:hypothetical protein